MISIPEDKLAEYFKDEDRINVLYAPFRNKTLNPKHWDSKLITWKNLISLYCTHNTIYKFSINQLKKAFVYNGRTPTCLDVIIQEMITNGEVQNMAEFFREDPKTWKEWVANTLFYKPLSWSFNKVKNAMVTTDLRNNLFVPIEIVHEDSNQLLTLLVQNYKNQLTDIQEILNYLGKNVDKLEDYKILFYDLHNHKKIDIKHLNNNQMNQLQNVLIKIGDGQKCECISEIEVSIYILQQNEKLLTEAIENLEDEVLKCVEEAKLHLRKGHRQVAKTCLLKKREVEKRITKKVNALHNVQVILEQMRDKHGDIHILEAYKKAISAFENTSKETGISVDAIEDTMLKLGEIMEIHSDMQDALSRPITEDGDNLEEELEELMKGKSSSDEERGIQNAMENLTLNLPDVPNSSKSSSELETEISSSQV